MHALIALLRHAWATDRREVCEAVKAGAATAALFPLIIIILEVIAL